jgi:hypothetical protein
LLKINSSRQNRHFKPNKGHIHDVTVYAKTIDFYRHLE